MRKKKEKEIKIKTADKFKTQSKERKGLKMI